MDYLLQIIIYVVRVFYPDVSKFIPTAFIIAQARHETGNYTSAIYKENKNLFGMKKPSKRKFWGIGENRGHATYSTIVHSVIDFFERARSYKRTLTAANGDYLAYLKNSKYAEDPNYLNAVRKMAGTIKIISPLEPIMGLCLVFFWPLNS